MNIEEYFENFINSQHLRDELAYCLTQSQVESFIRFKFGFWISTNFPGYLNVIEKNDIDLIIGNDSEIIFIEFGHLINLLRHKIQKEFEKVDSDIAKLDGKIAAFRNQHPELLVGKRVFVQTISLFSDFELVENRGRFHVNYNGNKNSGAFLKYGTSLRLENQNYIEKYRDIEIGTDGNGGFGTYKTLAVVPGELFLRWKVGDKQTLDI